MCPNSHFCMEYLAKNASFLTEFRLKRELVIFLKIDKLYLYWYCLYFSKKKMGVGVGSSVEKWNRGYLKL